MAVLAREIIKKKREGFSLDESEIQFMVNGYVDGSVPDYQMSAFLMAVFFKGMSESETLALTKTMLFSGIVVEFPEVPAFKVDKHSTGGVGDKTSLILGPIVAACGIPVPMISGRGLGHTGGTLDKLESIPGFNTQLSLEKFKVAVRDSAICFIGQTKDICPADKKIYALRDVTATVESLPLICASIMSKKLAEGIDGLVLDVKFGSGSFMKSTDDSEKLARALMKIGQGYGKKVVALLTNMNQPLGAYAGNSLEVLECVEIMQNKKKISELGHDLYADTRELSLELSAQMILLSGKVQTIEAARSMATDVLTSGRALEKFKELCRIHSGNLKALPLPKSKMQVVASSDGVMAHMNTEKIGVAGIALRAGRAKSSDVIAPTAGIEFHRKLGDVVKKGDVIYTIHGDEPERFADAKELLLQSFEIGQQCLDVKELIFKTLS